MTNVNKQFWQNHYIVAIFAIICTIFWGSASPAIKIGYEWLEVSSYDLAAKMVFAGVRFTFAGLILLVIAMITLKRFDILKKDDFMPYLSIGSLTSIQYICFYVGLTFTTGAKGSLFSSVNGFLIVLISPLIYKAEQLTWNKVLGCLIAIIGLICITLDSGVQEFSGFALKGEGLVVMASLLHAGSFYMTKSFAKTRAPILIAGWQLLIGGILLWIVGIILGGQINLLSTEAFLIIGYLAIASSMAYLFWNTLMAYNSISTVSMYNLFTPIFGTLLSGLVLHEVIFTWQNITSLVLVSLGIWLVNSSCVLFSKRSKAS